MNPRFRGARRYGGSLVFNFLAEQGVLMALFRQFDEKDQTVQFLHKGWPVTPKMKMGDPTELLEGLGQALELAYQKLRDAGAD